MPSRFPHSLRAVGALLRAVAYASGSCRAVAFASASLLVLAAPLAGAETVPVAMDDGTALATDLYFPTGEGPHPTILLRTPYNKSMPNVGGFARGFTDRGYALVIQDVRGRHASQGRAWAFADDGWDETRHDGQDTIEWITAQPWCNGKVGTWGGSALGITQAMLAPTAPPGLAAMHLTVAGSSYYHHLARPGGVYRQSLIDGWHAGQGFDGAQLELLRTHEHYDDFWRATDGLVVASRVRAPAVHVGGWYDIFSQGTIDTFRSWQHEGGEGARGKQMLVMGPWTHGVGNAKVGQLTFPANAKKVPDVADQARWFDFWLKGEGADPTVGPPVHYYLMGAVGERGAPGNEWRTAPDWPVTSREVPLYLHAGDPSGRGALPRALTGQAARGSLSASPPATAGEIAFTANPLLPVPTVGGRNLLLPAGAFDQRPVELHPDVRVFETAPLAAPLTVIGRVRATLSVSTDVAAADLHVRLTDVYPDGRSMLVLDGAADTRLREGFDRQAAMTPGRAATVAVDLWSTALVFNKGHRVRLSVSGSNFPRYRRCDHNWPDGGAPRMARVTLHTGPDHASALLLPVVGETPWAPAPAPPTSPPAAAAEEF